MKGWAGYVKALREPPLIPAAILGTSFIGFGALARSTDFGLGPALFSTLFVFALPGQVVLVDQLSRGLPLLSIALAVTVTAVRLLPMTVTLMPQLRGFRRPVWVDYLVSHFVAVTVWIESMRRLPLLPSVMRLPYFLGMATLLIGASAAGTVIGFFAAGFLPRTWAAALLFLTPLYFFLGLMSGARRFGDYVPLFIGFALGPVFFLLMPSIDLLLTGLVGGTVTFLIAKRQRSKVLPPSPSQP